MRAWRLSKINIDECESQTTWGKRKFMWKNRGVFTISLWENKGDQSVGV